MGMREMQAYRDLRLALLSLNNLLEQVLGGGQVLVYLTQLVQAVLVVLPPPPGLRTMDLVPWPVPTTPPVSPGVSGAACPSCPRSSLSSAGVADDGSCPVACPDPTTSMLKP
jgi:hypothetical protein